MAVLGLVSPVGGRRRRVEMGVVAVYAEGGTRRARERRVRMCRRGVRVTEWDLTSRRREVRVAAGRVKRRT
jgi:hypothetical protein